MERIEQHLTVGFDYPVVFTKGVFDAKNPVLADVADRLGEGVAHRVMVFVDEEVAKVHEGLVAKIEGYFAAHAEKLELAMQPQLLPGGERVKNDFRLVERLAGQMLEARLSRHAFVMAVGGGALLDAVGFAAALVHRGLRLVRVPTTVLSQNDGGVGVKNGINFAGQKNALGVFAPPFAVINDEEFLATLSRRQWLDGVAEAFKVAIIRDTAFFEFLKGSAAKLREREMGAMRHLIARCAALHLEHIRTGGDPFEFGNARPLDFGHWSAHKLETMSAFKISHGEAVAAGVLLDALYAVEKGWLGRGEFEAIHGAFRECGLPLWLEELDEIDETGRRMVYGGIGEFQEHLGGKLCVTFPDGIGRRREEHEIDLEAMDGAITELKRLAAR